MALTSSSTLSDALGHYNDNLSWDGDATKAALALEALRYIRVTRPQATARESVQINYIDFEADIKELKKFVTGSSSNSSRAKLADVSGT